MIRQLSALVALCLATSGVRLPAQEVPKGSSVIVARTKLSPAEAYRSAIQKLYVRGYTLKVSDPAALVATTDLGPASLSWTTAVLINLVVLSDSAGTYVRYNGRYNWGVGAVPITSPEPGKSNRQAEIWEELVTIAKEIGDGGVEIRK